MSRIKVDCPNCDHNFSISSDPHTRMVVQQRRISDKVIAAEIERGRWPNNLSGRWTPMNEFRTNWGWTGINWQQRQARIVTGNPAMGGYRGVVSRWHTIGTINV